MGGSRSVSDAYTAKGLQAKGVSGIQASNPDPSQSSTKTATKELFLKDGENGRRDNKKMFRNWNRKKV